jgi:hypothetical protein
VESSEAGLRALLAAGSSGEADAAVAALVRRGFRWRPLGGKEGNFGLINIGSDPAIALVERITNAIDAVIEAAARDADPAVLADWESPRDAVAALFGVGEGRLGALDGAVVAALADRIHVSIADGKRAQRPTLEIRDQGIGIAPDAMPSSILDLAGSNKLGKLHLAGAYGQGGSTTFAFTAGGTLIASAQEAGRLGVTFVRFRELDPKRNKNGRYDYLTTAGGSVATLDVSTSVFPPGTLVRHFDYELPRHHGPIDRADGLLGLVRASLFDPVLPLRLVDRRGLFGGTGDNAVTFAGARAELASAPGAMIAHRQSLSLPFGRRAQHGVVVVHYWLLAGEDAGGSVRPDPAHSVLVTNFGQTHDAWDHRFVVDALKLPFLKTSLVVQVELDALTAGAKRQLLSTTRDRLKRGTLHNELIEAVRDALLDESVLHDANVERRRRLLREQQFTDQRRLQRRFAELMEKFHPGSEPAARANGKGRDSRVTASSGEGGGGAEALQTQEHPTFVRFVSGDDPIEVPAERTATIRVESDAPNGYCARYSQARLVLAPDPPLAIETLRVSDFRGGRARFAVRATAPAGVSGRLSARLTAADGQVLAASTLFTIVASPSREQPADGAGRKGVRLPRIFEIFRERWSEFDFDETSVAHVSESRDDYTIFVNMDNRHIARLLASVPYQEQGIARMRGTYLLQTAFYAFLLHEQRAFFAGVDATELETYQRLELDRVARTVVTAIASVERIDSATLIETP